MIFPAEIDMATAGALGEQIAAELAPGAHAVIADMTATTFCDSAGITTLIRAEKQAAAHGAGGLGAFAAPRRCA